MKQIRNFFNLIIRGSAHTDDAQEKLHKMFLVRGGLFLSLMALVLTALNIYKGYRFMTFTTGCLTAGLAAASLAAHTGHIKLSGFIMSMLCVLNFSIYGITGQNEGFAILWILLIPICSMFLIGLRAGFLISLYFQIFLCLMFYTPLSKYLMNSYTRTFLTRFPVLYFTSFVLVTFLMYERHTLYARTHAQACTDALTGLNNRHCANELNKSFDTEEAYANASVIMIDINRLKYANDTLGHEAGDELITAAAELIRTAFKDDLCFRIGGDEFLVVSKRTDAGASVEQFKALVSAWHGRLVPELSVSVGTAVKTEQPGIRLEALMKLADDRMYADKKAYYARCGLTARV